MQCLTKSVMFDMYTNNKRDYVKENQLLLDFERVTIDDKFDVAVRGKNCDVRLVK
jgi:hypothetical protein